MVVLYRAQLDWWNFFYPFLGSFDLVWKGGLWICFWDNWGFESCKVFRTSIYHEAHYF